MWTRWPQENKTELLFKHLQSVLFHFMYFMSLPQWPIKWNEQRKQSKTLTFESCCQTVVIVMHLHLIKWHVEERVVNRILMVCLLTDVNEIKPAFILQVYGCWWCLQISCKLIMSLEASQLCLDGSHLGRQVHKYFYLNAERPNSNNCDFTPYNCENFWKLLI